MLRCPAFNRRSITTRSTNAKEGSTSSSGSGPTNDERFALRRETDRSIRSKAIDKLQYRKWTTGDVYAPHDLTSIEQKKWSRSQRPSVDAFDVLSMDPLEQYTVSFTLAKCKGFINDMLLELLDNVGIHDRDGTNPTILSDWTQACQPAKNS
ncbi:MAG: hypothetical protein Q9160_003681 [Pyrenula sp. 1 TL-2023]